MKAGSYEKKTVLRTILIGLLWAATLVAAIQPAQAGPDESFVGEIICGGWTFCPQGWAECNGQTLSVIENPALFGVIGTKYGGNGMTTFDLPNIQGRTMIHQGQGPGLTNRTMGQTGGVTLTGAQLPVHTHRIETGPAAGSSASPVNNRPANAPASDAHFTDAAPDAQMASTTGNTGGSLPHNNLQPYLTVKCCIATVGTYPR